MSRSGKRIYNQRTLITVLTLTYLLCHSVKTIEITFITEKYFKIAFTPFQQLGVVQFSFLFY